MSAESYLAIQAELSSDPLSQKANFPGALLATDDSLMGNIRVLEPTPSPRPVFTPPPGAHSSPITATTAVVQSMPAKPPSPTSTHSDITSHGMFNVTPSSPNLIAGLQVPLKKQTSPHPSRRRTKLVERPPEELAP